MEERNKRVEGTKPASGGRGARGVHAYTPAQNNNRGRGRGRGGRGGRGRGGSSSQRQRYTPVARVKPTTPYKGLEMVISGGQTGADRGGLIAAKELGIPTGGTAPLGYKTEAGSDLTLKREFNLKEGQCDYADRTKMNVDDADGTLAIRLHPGNGTDKTIGWCHLAQWTYGKDRAQSKDDGWRPVQVITDISEEKMEENVQQIKDFVLRNQIRVINVAGHRETTAGESGFTEKVRALLVKAFAGLDNLQSY